jgi:hypothetical protein
MITLTTEQLESELILLRKNKINLLFPTEATVKKYMKVKRNGQSFAVPRADREEVLKMVLTYRAEKRAAIIAKSKAATEFDYEGAILDQQEMRDYGC